MVRNCRRSQMFKPTNSTVSPLVFKNGQFGTQVFLDGLNRADNLLYQRELCSGRKTSR